MIEIDNFNANDPRLLDYIYLIYRRRYLVFGFVAIFCVIGTIAFISLPKRYAAEISFVSLKNHSKGFGEKGSDLSSLSAALAAVGGGQNTNEFYVGLIESRRIQDMLIEQLNLTEYFKTDVDGARGIMKEKTIIDELKGGFIKIRYVDRSAEMAQKIVVAYIENLNKYLQSVSLTEGQKYESFLKDRIKVVSKELAVTLQEREFRAKESLYFSLLKEFEIARANAAKERMDVDVLDQGEAIQGAVFPNKRLFMVLSVGLGLMVSLMVIFVQQWWAVVLSDPRNAYLAKKMREKRAIHSAS